jgi:hypothetical protein
MADIYHIWCNPKEGVDAKDFADKIHIFLGELVKAGKLESFRVMRMKLGFRSMDLPDFHIMMETKNMQQLDDAMSMVGRRTGELEGHHVAMNTLVDMESIQHALYRDFPDEFLGKIDA